MLHTSGAAWQIPPLARLSALLPATGLLFHAPRAAGSVTLNSGVFLNKIVNFLIVAFAIFPLIRQVHRLKREAPAAPAAPSTKDRPFCLSVIASKASCCPHCTSQLG